MKINKVSPDKSPYLQIVSTIALKPKELYFIGNIPSERIPTVAIVGSRKPTNYGHEVAQMLAYELAKKGIVIISGLALGIDSIAHRGALEAKGKTIAILANGLNSIYPATNRNLAKEILANDGAIISEYSPEVTPRMFRFLERNRIVSGLSDAIIVVEAAKRSGTLSTTARALEQNREVFVVPGNITSPMSAGCNELIKQGAYPLTSADDVIEIIAPDLLKPQQKLALGNNPLETKIISLLQSGIRDGESLLVQSEANSSDFSTTLTILEINGIIRSLGGNQWTLKN